MCWVSAAGRRSTKSLDDVWPARAGALEHASVAGPAARGSNATVAAPAQQMESIMIAFSGCARCAVHNELFQLFSFSLSRTAATADQEGSAPAAVHASPSTAGATKLRVQALLLEVVASTLCYIDYRTLRSWWACVPAVVQSTRSAG